MLERALAFVKSLFTRPHHPRCPHCGSCFTKRNGTYWRRPFDFGGRTQIRHQRWYCNNCHRSIYVPDEGIAQHAWYMRRVQRKGLDHYTHLGSSLRKIAECLRSELNPGTERDCIWNPLARDHPLPEADRSRLSHTSLWRWLQKAGQRLQVRSGLFAAIRASAALTSDATGIVICGARQGVLVVVDALTRVVYSFRRITEETGEQVLKHFDDLKTQGLNLSTVKALVTDRHGAYQYVREVGLWWAELQHCVFHLWRNLGGLWARYEKRWGEAKVKHLQGLVHQVWDASSMEQAQRALQQLKREFGQIKVVRFVGDTFAGATLHLRGVVLGLPRTSGVAEWVFRRYKPRYRQLQCFMSEAGSDAFNALWRVYVNFQRYQERYERKRKYPYAGKCPLEIAHTDLLGVTWLDVAEV